MFVDSVLCWIEAGGAAVCFVNSSNALFVPNTAPDDSGLDICIPSMCIRAGDMNQVRRYIESGGVACSIHY